MNDKIIVTNQTALSQKYDKAGIAKINTAVKALLQADASRGITTSVIYLDDQAAMTKVGGKAVTTAASPKQNKDAIDAIAKSINPDYLMILGAPDVVPHQDLQNPAYTPGSDDDVHAEGDLPYACDVPYSRDPAKFVGPTRVVGRLPDLEGANDPAHLVALLTVAAGYKSSPAQNYAPYFGLSALVWKGSTTLSLENIFGNAASLLTSPTAGPGYPQGEMKALTHFINCHGGQADPRFYGQKGSSYPPSVTTSDTTGQIQKGTVAAAECCYGGELYDSVTLGIDMPICQSYLSQGAYGFFGSTTIAYGPADSNGSADFICQDFLIQVLGGASLGRAALVARQRYVERNSQMDAFDLKTLAQFCLLGDPSVVPVAAAAGAAAPKSAPDAKAQRFARAERRVKLKQMGEFLSQTKPTASKKVPAGRVSPSTKTALANIAKKAGIQDGKPFSAFAVRDKSPHRKGAGKSESVPSRYFIKVGKPKKSHAGLHLGVGVVAKELNGRIVDYRIYYQR